MGGKDDPASNPEPIPISWALIIDAVILKYHRHFLGWRDVIAGDQ